jgi:hypothetical protein
MESGYLAAVMFNTKFGSFYSCDAEFIIGDIMDGSAQFVSLHDTMEEAHHAAHTFAFQCRDLDRNENQFDRMYGAMLNA